MVDAARIASEMTQLTQTGLPEVARLCLVTAVDIEFKTVTDLLDQKDYSSEKTIKICRGIFGARRITVLQCGMGAKRFAQWLADHLKKNQYDVLIVAGLAGGLDPRLKAGDAVIYDLCCKARGELSPVGSKEKPSARDEKASIHCDDRCSKLLFELLQSAGRRSFRGPGLTVDQIVINAQDKIRLGVDHKVLAVDMESFEILSICADFKLPATVLRVISDDAGTDLPDFNYAAGSDGRINLWRMALALATRPSASIRFMLGIRPMIKSLRTNLKTILSV